jgi:hypothetical protein
VFGSVEWARQDRGTICDGMLLKTIKIALWVLFTNSYAEEGELNVIVKDGIDLTKL